MHEFVFGVGWVIVLRREPQIWRLPDPDRKWIHTGDNDPLSHVELFAKNDQRSLDLLLHDSVSGTMPAILLQSVHHLVET